MKLKNMITEGKITERKPGDPHTSHKGVPSWFNDMAPEAQRVYIAKHPNSGPAKALKQKNEIKVRDDGYREYENDEESDFREPHERKKLESVYKRIIKEQI